MTNILDIPLDAWVIILRHIDKFNLIPTYNKLFISRAICVPVKEKLNTFWIVISQSRYIDTIESFDEMPDSIESKIALHKLQQLGIGQERACELIRTANGSLSGALEIVGW